MLTSQNDMITVLRQLDDNWYEGELGNQIGIFPVAYVEVNDRLALFHLLMLLS